MKISLGNVLFYWPKNKIEEFYIDAAESSADTIYLGESVCSKRRELKLGDWINIGKELSAKGKSVVLSSLALIEAKSELASLKKVCDNNEFLVEANDFATVQILSSAGVPFVAGTGLNLYNHYDLKVMVDRGMQRWVMPVELSKDWLRNTLSHCDDLSIRGKFDVEVFSYGYLPLAYSARCFTARSENRAKDECGLCCINYPQGREVGSQEGLELFRLNGIQTMSGVRQNLINDLASMKGLVDVVRISPDDVGSLTIVEQFKEQIQTPSTHIIGNSCNGYWHKIEGMKVITELTVDA